MHTHPIMIMCWWTDWNILVTILQEDLKRVNSKFLTYILTSAVFFIHLQTSVNSYKSFKSAFQPLIQLPWQQLRKKENISVQLLSKYLQWDSNKGQFPLFPLWANGNFVAIAMKAHAQQQ